MPDVRSSRRALGRFGWKATQPSVEQQIATALLDDMGLTSWLRPETACTKVQFECRKLDHPGEVSARELDQITTYVSLRGVPARRDLTNPIVRRGRELFVTIGCSSCHTPRHVTAPEVTFVELANQVIFPYTDLLLHDMGPGLADDVKEFEAQGFEWRPPHSGALGCYEPFMADSDYSTMDARGVSKRRSSGTTEKHVKRIATMSPLLAANAMRS